MKEKQKVFHLIILDESGSMQSIKDETISGFNELIQNIGHKEKEFPGQEHRVSLFTFNNSGIKALLFNKKPGKLMPLNHNNYRPNSLTPLYDAMATAINRLRAETDQFPGASVLVNVITDGLENASKEYSGETIKKLVEELTQKNWTFVYMGANHDVFKMSASLSISNYLSFDTKDLKNTLHNVDRCMVSYCRKIENNQDATDGFFDAQDKRQKQEKED